MKPVCLIIMDGWGVNEGAPGNAAAAANTPYIDALIKKYSHTTLDPTGRSVGLPSGQMGNSEVGHLTLGAGRVVLQELSRVSRAIEDKTFFDNKKLRETLSSVKESGGALHLMGLVSDGGVHSHIDHLAALLDAAKSQGVERVYIHAFLDGRDTGPRSGAGYIRQLLETIEAKGVGRVATVSGRFYAMDRDTRWDRVEKAFLAISRGEGLRAATPLEAVEESYERGEGDEFVLPTVIDGGASVADGDAVIFFNFRADRARELTAAFVGEGFDGFSVAGRPELKEFVTMTEYKKSLPVKVLFPPRKIKNILAEVLSEQGIRQFRVSETEKYAHVTFFFNGGVEEPFSGEDRCLIPSVKDVPTYDLSPAMRAAEIADAAKEKIEEGGYGFILMNFANGDMVGHTGVFDAAVKACEAVDRAVSVVVEAAREKGWTVLLTSDHGNVEELYLTDPEEPITAHSTLPVPFVLIDDELKHVPLTSGGLQDIAPTVLKLMEIELPEEMEGRPLF